MKKQHSKQARELTSSPQVGHLDETLTEVASATAIRVKKWRLPIISALVVLALAIAGYSAYTAIRWSRVESLNAALYDLFGTPQAKEEGYEPDTTKLESLLADARGEPVERVVLKTAATHYLKVAERLSGKAAGMDMDAATLEAMKKARDEARRLSQLARDHYPDDVDIQTWARNLSDRIAAEEDTTWLPGGWKFSQPPAAMAGSAAATSGGAPPEAAGERQPESPQEPGK